MLVSLISCVVCVFIGVYFIFVFRDSILFMSISWISYFKFYLEDFVGFYFIIVVRDLKFFNKFLVL